jgi:kinesin family protein 2/24
MIYCSKSDKSKIIMIACVGPGFSSANHTINTLRYSDRLKEKTNQINNNLMLQKYLIK